MKYNFNYFKDGALNAVAQALPNSTIWGLLLFRQAIWKNMSAILSTEYIILSHEVLLEKESCSRYRSGLLISNNFK